MDDTKKHLTLGLRGLCKALRGLWHVEYRLTAYADGHPRHTYGTSRRLMRATARHCTAQTWTLYKRGPLGIKEHPIMSNEQE